MRTTGKIIKLLLLVVFAAILLIIAGGYFFGERAIRVGIETQATKTLNVGVSVDDIDVGVFQGKMGISGLAVNNPAGYKEEYFLKLGKGDVKVDIGSLMSDKVKIERIGLNGVDLTLEQKGMSSNLKDILDSMPKGEKKPKAKDGKKLETDELEITDVNVTVKLGVLEGKGDTVNLKLAPIRMKNLGSDGELDTGELAAQIVLAISKGIAEQGVGALPEEMLKNLEGSVNSVIEAGFEGIEEGKKKIEESIEKGKEAGEEIIEGVKGLFKKKEDK